MVLRITIEPTTLVVNVHGAPARVWQGMTNAGSAVHCLVVAVGVASADAAGNAQLAEQLSELQLVVPLPELLDAYPPHVREVDAPGTVQ